MPLARRRPGPRAASRRPARLREPTAAAAGSRSPEPRAVRRAPPRPAPARTAGSSPAWARSRSSGVGVHRQWRSETALAGDAVGAQERHTAAREQDGGDQRRAPRSAREAAAGRRPGHEREAQERGGVEGQHHPHVPASRWTGERRARSRAAATSIRTRAPTRSSQGARLKNSHQTRITSPRPSSAQQRRRSPASGSDEGHAEPDQPLQHDGDDAGPQPERLLGGRFVGRAVVMAI